MRERISSTSTSDRHARLVSVEQELRRLEAELAMLVRSVEQDRAFTADGHLTMGGFLRGELRWSQQQVTARRRVGRLLDEAPTVVEHLHAGAIGLAQAYAFGKAAANPAVRWPTRRSRRVVAAACALVVVRRVPHVDPGVGATGRRREPRRGGV